MSGGLRSFVACSTEWLALEPGAAILRTQGALAAAGFGVFRELLEECGTAAGSGTPLDLPLLSPIRYKVQGARQGFLGGARI